MIDVISHSQICKTNLITNHIKQSVQLTPDNLFDQKKKMQLSRFQHSKKKEFCREEKTKMFKKHTQLVAQENSQPEKYGVRQSQAPWKIRIDDRLSRALRTSNNYNVLHFTFINQTALKGQENYDYSFSSSYFDFKKATNVRLTEDYLFVSLEDLNTTKVTVKYLVDRLRSYGNEKFYRISNCIEKMEMIIKKVSQIMENFKEYYSQEMLDKTLLKFKGRAYFGIYNVYENSEFQAKGLFISQKLITMLGHNPYQLAIRFARLGAIRDFQISSTASYSELISNYIELMYDCSALIVQNGFQPNCFESSLASSAKKFDVQLFLNNKQGKVIAQTISHLPNPCYVIQQLTKVKFTKQDSSIRTIQQPYRQQIMQIQHTLNTKTINEIKIQNQDSKDQKQQQFSHKRQNEQMVIQEEKSIIQIYDPFIRKSKKNHMKICTYRSIKKIAKDSNKNISQKELEQ